MHPHPFVPGWHVWSNWRFRQPRCGVHSLPEGQLFPLCWLNNAYPMRARHLQLGSAGQLPVRLQRMSRWLLLYSIGCELLHHLRSMPAGHHNISLGTVICGIL